MVPATKLGEHALAALLRLVVRLELAVLHEVHVRGAVPLAEHGLPTVQVQALRPFGQLLVRLDLQGLPAPLGHLGHGGEELRLGPGGHVLAVLGAILGAPAHGALEPLRLVHGRSEEGHGQHGQLRLGERKHVRVVHAREERVVAEVGPGPELRDAHGLPRLRGVGLPEGAPEHLEHVLRHVPLLVHVRAGRHVALALGLGAHHGEELGHARLLARLGALVHAPGQVPRLVVLEEPLEVPAVHK
mmetsp:Transcript_2802/g.9172  ORF Transcript_2802/g.9172 Transcript_2802/m.9172 type:complete len:244 (-) Transcript_2802:1728-2459(-)